MIADLIVADLDDTLLNSHEEITPRTERAVKSLMGRGVHVTLASGRSYPSMLPYIRQLGIVCPIIACQGATIIRHDSAEILRQFDIDRDVAREIVRSMRRDNVYIQTYDMKAFYFESEGEHSALYRRLSAIEGHAVGDLTAFIDGPVPKLLCIAEPDVIRAQYERMRALYGDRLEVTISKPFYLELTHKQANKGEAVRYVADLLHIPRERVACIGDSYNDLPMLRYAGTSVSMVESLDEIKQMTKFVAGSHDEDGVAKLFERWIEDDAQ